jgi:hypothetical protein
MEMRLTLTIADTGTSRRSRWAFQADICRTAREIWGIVVSPERRGIRIGYQEYPAVITKNIGIAMGLLMTVYEGGFLHDIHRSFV